MEESNVFKIKDDDDDDDDDDDQLDMNSTCHPFISCVK